ncbi:hypothetical protein BUALT_Bualt05G0162900 [Buddleja alternifolia]|uniref:Protein DETOXIFICATION n=1 Tax=Buddleja alternifolia TaxID=168488 RepID=A0AAV6XJM4_9LAMI|nr:hypothetical protein BUALT_Bualt05G0162900 [Buddleja alternifolia]
MAEGGGAQPLLSTVHGGDGFNYENYSQFLPKLESSSDEEDDIKPINGVTNLAREFGLSSALETYCGQAYGANQFQMLGTYMQRSWIILNATALLSLPLFIFATPLLKFLGQTEYISKEAGKVALWMIPQQFAYALMLPSTKFLQAQSKVVAIAVIAGIALCLHAFFSWLLVSNLGWGLVGAAVVLDGSWWFIGVAQLLYVVGGGCGECWGGFSWKGFHDLWGFFKVSVASAVMMCLEIWYMMSLTLFAGYLEDAEISIDAFSICLNILGWACTVAFGLNVASSVRVSNELGSRHPGKARFSVMVIGVSSLLIGLFFSFILVVSRKQYPAIFSNSLEVQMLVEKLTPLLGISMVFTNVQYALSGVVIGAGWQVPVAYMSTGCYFIFGVPIGVVMAFKFKMGIQGLWYGMVFGLCLQTSLLLWMIWNTDWNKEAYVAKERLQRQRERTSVDGEGGSSLVLDNESIRKEEVQNETFSLSVSKEIKEISVRIVHAGGRIEMYQKALPVSRLIRKYPGMCIARPEVFKRPHESLLSDDEMLLPGNKYFVIRSTTVEKLKRRKGRKNENYESSDDQSLESKDCFEKNVCTSGDFFVPKESWSKCSLRKNVKEKSQFVPPIQRPRRVWKESEWEPSLTSIQEVSL